MLSQRVAAAAGLLVLTQALGCKSPEDIGFDAAVLYTAPMAAIGADTTTMPCKERLGLYEEFIGKENERASLKSKVEGARDKEGFDKGFSRVSDTSVNVLAAFERDCPEQAPNARELAAGVARELGVEGKLPSDDTK
ncbi:MAG: hypothetical protein KUG77_14505 [Nannocystaceae bacterium]|nr:hypothetical protein [Nannocystaceae bacterium]